MLLGDEEGRVGSKASGPGEDDRGPQNLYGDAFAGLEAGSAAQTGAEDRTGVQAQLHELIVTVELPRQDRCPDSGSGVLSVW